MIGVAAVVCCVAGVAGDMIQDWKVGHILGATPLKMQIGGIIGVIAAALTLTFSLQLLLASGLIAGQALTGILTAGIKALNIKLPTSLANPLFGLAIFFILGFILIYFPYKKMIESGEYDSAPDEAES